MPLLQNAQMIKNLLQPTMKDSNSNSTFSAIENAKIIQGMMQPAPVAPQ
jgi:hypothetical protein